MPTIEILKVTDSGASVVCCRYLAFESEAPQCFAEWAMHFAHRNHRDEADGITKQLEDNQFNRCIIGVAEYVWELTDME